MFEVQHVGWLRVCDVDGLLDEILLMAAFLASRQTLLDTLQTSSLTDLFVVSLKLFVLFHFILNDKNRWKINLKHQCFHI